MSKRPGNGKGLSPQQARFVEAYLADPSMNVQAAMRVAGYGDGFIRGHSHRMLDRPAVKVAVEAAIAARSRRTQITQDDVLRELYIILTSDVRNFHVDDEGQLVLREGVPDWAWRAVSSVKHKIRTFTDDNGNTETNREIEFRLWDKTSATKQVGEHLGMYLKKIEHKLPEGGGVLAVPMPVDPAQWAEIAAAQQRALTAGRATKTE